MINNTDALNLTYKNGFKIVTYQDKDDLIKVMIRKNKPLQDSFKQLFDEMEI